MNIDLTTPALLFSTISLLMLAFTNRFLGLATIVRKLHADHLESPNEVYLSEIKNLRTRIRLIRDMQLLGILSLLLCVICMAVLFLGYQRAGEYIFMSSLLLLGSALVLSLLEIRMSICALDLHLQQMQQ